MHVADYQKARADEELSRKALDRTKELYSHGAMAAKDLELAQDTEDKAKVDVQTAAEHVRVLGGDPDHPSSLIELRAPVSGTIVEQNVAGFEGIKSLDNTPNLFTIADLSQVWVVCDVFENDLGEVHAGDAAEIRLNAYPDRAVSWQSREHLHACLIPTPVPPKCALCCRIAMERFVPKCLPLQLSVPGNCMIASLSPAPP